MCTILHCVQLTRSLFFSEVTMLFKIGNVWQSKPVKLAFRRTRI